MKTFVLFTVNSVTLEKSKYTTYMSRSNRSRFTQSTNPFMQERAYQQAASQPLDSSLVPSGAIAETMTVQGAISKTFILTGLMLLTALFSYARPSGLFMFGGAIGGLIVVLITVRQPHKSPTLAPIYALLEGLFIGSVSAQFAALLDGIVFNAVMLTVATLFSMLFIYRSGIIPVTNKLRVGVTMATGAVALVYLLSIVLNLFGLQVPFLHEGGTIGIGVSAVIIGIAALNLLLDFDNFEKGEQYRAPQYMEWFSAMGLLITLVWLYIEFLRLLAILSND